MLLGKLKTLVIKKLRLAIQISDNTTDASIIPDHNKTQCEYGLHDQCDFYEECFIPDNSHSRTGICICIDGFERGDNYTCVNVSIGIKKIGCIYFISLSFW